MLFFLYGIYLEDNDMTYTSERLRELRDKYSEGDDDMSFYPARLTYLEARVNGEEYSVDVEGMVYDDKFILKDADIVKYNENTEDYETQEYSQSLLETHFEKQIIDKLQNLGFNVEKVEY